MVGIDFASLTVQDAPTWIAALLSVAIAARLSLPRARSERVSLAAPATLACLTILDLSLVLTVTFVCSAALVAGLSARVPGVAVASTAGTAARSVVLLGAMWLAVGGLGNLLADGPRSLTFRGLLVGAGWAMATTRGDLPLRARKVVSMTRGVGYLVDLGLAAIAAISAVLVGTLFVTGGVWAAAVAALPWALTHGLSTAMIRAHEIERLSIRAIGRLPEAAGLVETNHASAVESLSRRLAEHLGIRGTRLADLASAAALHEIGLVWASQSGELRGGYSQRDVARWGAEMLGETASLARPAAIIERQFDSFRIPGGGQDPAIDTRSQIVSLACEFEHLRANGFDEAEAIDEIYRQASFRFSPTVVAALVPSLHEVRTS